MPICGLSKACQANGKPAGPGVAHVKTVSKHSKSFPLHVDLLGVLTKGYTPQSQSDLMQVNTVLSRLNYTLPFALLIATEGEVNPYSASLPTTSLPTLFPHPTPMAPTLTVIHPLLLPTASQATTITAFTAKCPWHKNQPHDIDP